MVDQLHLVSVLRWYMGREDVARDAARVVAGGPLALIGEARDDVVGFADRIDAARPVVDLSKGTPSEKSLRELYAEHPDTVVLAPRPDRVIGAIGFIAQPYYLPIRALRARPHEAMPLLREAMAQVGVRSPIERLGANAMVGLAAYRWRGLRELREAASRIGAVLDGGNLSAGARRLEVSRQALTKYIVRRIA